MKNNVQLITYVDRLIGSRSTSTSASTSIEALHQLLVQQLADLFSGVHILPFYYPMDGSDAGFDPIDHTAVDSRLGSWEDVAALGRDFDVMADLIVNHISAASKEFQDVLALGKSSEYWDLFLSKDKIFPRAAGGLSKEAQQKIYRPRPGSCFTEYKLSDNTAVDFWTTFTDSQIDIDVYSESGKRYLSKILEKFQESNVRSIRLDAAGYAVKKAGTSCFMLEKTFDFINELSLQAKRMGMETLVEIHSHYQTQIEIAKRVGRVYDFALPPLILHSIFEKNFDALGHWLQISPRNCVTVLDTHDGIGIIDVGPKAEQAGLLSTDEIDDLVKQIHIRSRGDSLKATGTAASNLDLYQVNCTYYDALGQNNFDYLVARAIQFFASGVPQVYYAGLFCQPNAMDLLAETHVGRDINRPYLNLNFDPVDTLAPLLEKPVVQALFELIRIRNTCQAFDGKFSLNASSECLALSWESERSESKIQLTVNIVERSAIIQMDETGSIKRVNLNELLS